MKKTFLFFAIFTLYVNAFAQTLCTKHTVIKPILQSESLKVMDTPAVYETKTVKMIIRDGFWDIEIKSGLPCKVWKEPEYQTIYEQIVIVPATYKMVAVQRKIRDGEIYTFLGDCN